MLLHHRLLDFKLTDIFGGLLKTFLNNLEKLPLSAWTASVVAKVS